MTPAFDPNTIRDLYKAPLDSRGEDNGQITIIGGSKLFHGAPLFSLTVASKIVDMVFFGTPDKSVGKVAENLKSKLLSFIWIPWDEVGEYIKKSEVVLIGPGFMSFRSEKDKSVVEKTKEITKELLTKHKDKKWVIDAGSLQVMEPQWIPEGSILTPNTKEYAGLFGNSIPSEIAQKYKCIIVLKGPITLVVTPKESFEIGGGNAGLTKGGTGDVLAGLTAALAAKNDMTLAALCASYITKAAGDKLYKGVGTNYSAEDLAAIVPTVLNELSK